MSEFYDLPYTGKQIEDKLALVDEMSTKLGVNSVSKAFKVYPQGDQKLAIIDNKIKVGIRNAEMEIVDGAGDEELKTQLTNLKEAVDANPNEIYYSLVVRSASYHKGTIASVDVNNREIVVNDGPTEGNFIQVNLENNKDRTSNPKKDDPANFNVYNNFIIEGYPELGTIDIGFNTITAGINSSAVNNSSVAMGKNARALGKFTVAFGEDTIAGHRALVAGAACEALGQESIAAGLTSKATGTQSTAMGNNAKAQGPSSVALGYYTTASGDYGFAFNGYTEASAKNATAGGWHSEAKHTGAFTMGCYTRSSADYQTVLGTYNKGHAEALFIIGNGTSSSNTSNALTVTKKGNVKVSGSISFESGGIGVGKKKSTSGYFMGTNCLANTVVKLPLGQTYTDYYKIENDGSSYKYSWNISCGTVKLTLTPSVIVQEDSKAPKTYTAALTGDVGNYVLTVTLPFDYNNTDKTYILGMTYLSFDISLPSVLKFKSFANGSDLRAAEYASLTQPSHGTAIGHSASALGHVSTAIGFGALSAGSSSMAIGKNVVANAANAIVIGNSSVANHDNAIILGRNCTSTESDQVILGYQNAFTVNKDGTATVKTGPKKAKDVATMEYVDTEIGKISAPDLSGYAPVSHNHNEYALTDHTHNYAASSHLHDDKYALKSHTHTEYASNMHPSQIATDLNLGHVKGLNATLLVNGIKGESGSTTYFANAFSLEKDKQYKVILLPHTSGSDPANFSASATFDIDAGASWDNPQKFTISNGSAIFTAEYPGKINAFIMNVTAGGGSNQYYKIYISEIPLDSVSINSDGTMQVHTVSKAKIAASATRTDFATRALQDNSGNIFSETYLKKADLPNGFLSVVPCSDESKNVYTQSEGGKTIDISQFIGDATIDSLIGVSLRFITWLKDTNGNSYAYNAFVTDFSQRYTLEGTRYFTVNAGIVNQIDDVSCGTCFYAFNITEDKKLRFLRCKATLSNNNTLDSISIDNLVLFFLK